jgi:hypothetical protein
MDDPLDSAAPEHAALPAAPDAPGILQALPGLTRIAVSAAWRTTEWTVGATARAYGRVARAAVSGDSPRDVMRDVGDEVRGYLQDMLGIVEGDGLWSARRGGQSSSSADALRARGEELLRRSADVRFNEDMHPAYEAILAQLSPDEARILRLLALEGPQPTVDIRTARPLGIGSELIAPGLSMIGAQAGCRHPDRVHPYLNNLFRLGLVWFSREPVEDRLRYQVLEAQPEVLDALHRAGRGRTVRRSVHLTPFGEDFCRTCLPLERPVTTDEFEAITGS